MHTLSWKTEPQPQSGPQSDHAPNPQKLTRKLIISWPVTAGIRHIWQRTTDTLSEPKSGDRSSTDATMSELVYTWYSGNFQAKINKWYRKCQVSRNTAPTNSKAPQSRWKQTITAYQKLAPAIYSIAFTEPNCVCRRDHCPRIKSRSQTRASHTKTAYN